MMQVLLSPLPAGPMWWLWVGTSVTAASRVGPRLTSSSTRSASRARSLSRILTLSLRTKRGLLPRCRGVMKTATISLLTTPDSQLPNMYNSHKSWSHRLRRSGRRYLRSSQRIRLWRRWQSKPPLINQKKKQKSINHQKNHKTKKKQHK